MASKHVVKKRLADGSVKEYSYDREKRSSVDKDSLTAMLTAYRKSGPWKSKSLETQKKQLRYMDPLYDMGNVKVARVRRRDIADLADDMLEEIGPGAAAEFLKVTKTIFTWAVNREWITHSPASGISPPAGGEWQAWTDEEYELAADVFCEPIRRAVILARWTGQRRGDLISMTWQHINGGAIRIRQSKTDMLVTIPICAELERNLHEWRESAEPSATILTTVTGKPWYPSYLSVGIIDEWHSAIGRAGPPLHGLRKLAAASFAAAGCSAHEIASITGHKTLSMVQHYADSVDRERLAFAAVKRLETALGNQAETTP